MKKIIAFSGSNSKHSINQKLIRSIASLHEGIEVLNLRDYQAPVYGIDIENEDGFPESMIALNKKFKDADGFIVSTPEHNGSMPAVLKNTIDWLSRIEPKVFNDKPTLFLSTSPGPRGGASALSHITAIMPFRGAQVIGSHSQGNFEDHYNDGELSEELKNRLKPLMNDLYAAL
jgi:chromate reductase, NAD(P)H dehydrogenase (quinone)